MVSLYIEDTLETITESDIDAQRNSLLKLIMVLNPIEELTLSMDCSLLSVLLGDQGRYVNAKNVHLCSQNAILWRTST